MAALSSDRLTPERTGDQTVHPVAAATKIYAGALTVLDSAGNAAPGSTTTGLIPVGRADEQVDNSAGVAGALFVPARRGVFRFDNSASSDLIGRTEIGKDVYIVDDHTVAKTSATSTRSVAGKVVDVDAQGVWVRIGV